MTGTVRRWLARLLVAAGALMLLAVAVNLTLAAAYRRHADATLERMRVSANAVGEPAALSAPASLATGEPIGTLEIPRLGLSSVVVEGEDDSVLEAAIGHLPDTPLPWHAGNSALAAHRDAIFRPLKDIHLGDVLQLRTPHGDFEYRVRDTMIVKPEDVWVLDSTPVTMLTLISCYPFTYIGRAPLRFIVRAERIPPAGHDVD